MSDDTKDTKFKPGNPGGPGRPAGSRNKLAEDFLAALHADFQEHGAETIAQVRAEKPDQYLKVIASILPKELNVRVSDLDGLNDEELDGRIAALARALQLEAGPGESAGREETPPRTH